MIRHRACALAGALCILLMAPTARAQEATGCDYPGNLTILNAWANAYTPSNSEWNTWRSCNNNQQRAIGLNPAGPMAPSLTDRLDNPQYREFPKLAGENTYAPGTGSRQRMSIVNGTLYAAHFDGADIGAKANNALASCDAEVGSTGHCVVALDPGTWTLPTAILITRSRVTLDCRGATLVLPADTEDVAVRVNLAQVGSLSGATLVDVTVRNCTVDASSPDTLQTWDGASTPSSIVDHRGGAVTAYKVDGLRFEDLRILDPPGPGIWVSESDGVINAVEVAGTRLPTGFSDKDSDGIIAGGASAGGLQLANVYVHNTAGIGVRLLQRASARGVRVRDAARACVAQRPLTHGTVAGVGNVNAEGAVTIAWIDLEGCNAADATSDPRAAALIIAHTSTPAPMGTQVIGGIIRSTQAAAVVLDGVADITLANLTIEPWAANGSATLRHGIALGGATSNVTLSDLDLQAGTNAAGGILDDAPGPLTISGGRYDGFNLAIPGLVLAEQSPTGETRVIGATFSTWGTSAIDTDVDSDETLSGVMVTDTVFAANGGQCASCGAIDVTLTGASAQLATWNRSVIANNRFRGNSRPFRVVKAGTTANAVVGGVQLAGNVFNDTAEPTLPDTQGWLFGQNDGGTTAPVPSWSTDWIAPASTAYGQVLCVDSGNDEALIVCQTGTTARFVVGIAAGVGTAVITHGRVLGVACTGTINRGDLVGRSGATNGSVAATATPAVGEAIGIALTACSSSVVTVFVGKQ